jgi:hypothetical protein
VSVHQHESVQNSAILDYQYIKKNQKLDFVPETIEYATAFQPSHHYVIDKQVILSPHNLPSFDVFNFYKGSDLGMPSKIKLAVERGIENQGAAKAQALCEGERFCGLGNERVAWEPLP